MHDPMTRRQRMPDEVRALASPWPSLVGTIPDLTPELEREFRFCQRVTKTERGYLMGGTMKGGSSSLWYPATEAQRAAYVRWRAIEGMGDETQGNGGAGGAAVGEGEAAAYDDLRALLEAHGVELVGRAPRGMSSFYGLTHSILRSLPRSHLSRKQFSRLQIGGFGPDGAKASAYQAGTVIMYDFAVRGARRTYAGLLLHELGHAHEHALSDAAQARLHPRYHAIVRGKALFAVEFLLDVAARKFYQQLVFSEFLAETYLAYTACGHALRTFMLDGVSDPDVRRAWHYIYDQFRDTFDGVEYD